jgi:hypothetical protein
MEQTAKLEGVEFGKGIPFAPALTFQSVREIAGEKIKSSYWKYCGVNVTTEEIEGKAAKAWAYKADVADITLYATEGETLNALIHRCARVFRAAQKEQAA